MASGAMATADGAMATADDAMAMAGAASRANTELRDETVASFQQAKADMAHNVRDERS